MECGARATRKSTRPASRTSEPGSHIPMTRHLGEVGDAATVMGVVMGAGPPYMSL